MCRVKPFWGISLRGGTIFICSASLIWNVICFILMIIVIIKGVQSSSDRLKKLEEIANITKKVPIATTARPTRRPTKFRPIYFNEIPNRSKDFCSFVKGLKNYPDYYGRYGFQDNESLQEYFKLLRDYEIDDFDDKNNQTEEERRKEIQKEIENKQNLSDFKVNYKSWKICAAVATCAIISVISLSIILFWGLYKHKPMHILSYLIISIIILIMDFFLGLFILFKAVGSDKSWNFWMTKYDGWIGILMLVSVALRVLFCVWIWSYYKELKETLKQETDQYKQKSQEFYEYVQEE